MSFVGKWFGFGQNEHFDRGLGAYERKQYGEAAAHFAQVLETEHNERLREKAKSYLAGSLSRLGVKNLRDGNPKDAITVLSQALEIRPRFADVHLNLAVALAADGKHGEALLHTEQAITLNPRYALAYLRQAGIKIQLGQIEDGVADAEKAFEMSDPLAEQHETLFRSFASGTDMKGLSAFLLTADVPAPSDVPKLVELGDAAMHSGNWDMAISSYTQAIEFAPGYADLHVRLGQALYEKGLVNESITEYERATKLNPNYSEAHALRGISLRRLGDENGAQEAFRQALNADPNNMIASHEMLEV